MDGLPYIPLQERVATELRESIQRGSLSQKQSIPPSSELAKRYGVGKSTMLKILKRLQHENVVRLHSRRKGFVPANSTDTEQTVVSEKKPEAGVKHKQVVMLTACERDYFLRYSNGEELPFTPWSSSIVDSFILCCSKNNCSVRVSFYDISANASSTVDSLMSLFNGFGQPMGCALFVSHNDKQPQLLRELDSHRLPWIALDCPNRLTTNNFACGDNFGAGRMLGHYFRELGFNRVVYLTEKDSPPDGSSANKFDGLKLGFNVGTSNRRIDYITPERSSDLEKGAYAAVTDHIRENGAPDAIFTFTEKLAVGTLQACLDQDVDVPGQTSVVTSGAGDAIWPRSIAELKYPLQEVGWNAAEMLEKMMQEGTWHIPGKLMPFEFILRESVKVDERVIEKLQSIYPEIKISIEARRQLIDK